MLPCAGIVEQEDTVKTRTSAIAIVVAGVATMLAGASALGAPTTPISCGMIVTNSIKAGNDLNNCAGNGLLAGANGITIDLNRHTIDGSGAGDGVTTNGHTGVNVTNGFVQEFNSGVHVDVGSANAKASQVTATAPSAVTRSRRLIAAPRGSQTKSIGAPVAIISRVRTSPKTLIGPTERIYAAVIWQCAL